MGIRHHFNFGAWVDDLDLVRKQLSHYFTLSNFLWIQGRIDWACGISFQTWSVISRLAFNVESNFLIFIYFASIMGEMGGWWNGMVLAKNSGYNWQLVEYRQKEWSGVEQTPISRSSLQPSLSTQKHHNLSPTNLGGLQKNILRASLDVASSYLHF